MSDRSPASYLWWRLPVLYLPSGTWDILGTNAALLQDNGDGTWTVKYADTANRLALTTDDAFGWADPLDHRWVNMCRSDTKNQLATVFNLSGSAKCDWVCPSPINGPTADQVPQAFSDGVCIPASTLNVSAGFIINLKRSDIVHDALTTGTRSGAYAFFAPSSYFKTYKGCFFDGTIGSPSSFNFGGTFPQVADFDNNYIWICSQMQTKPTSGVYTIFTDLCGNIWNDIPAGTNDNLNVLMTLNRGSISTTWETSGTYDTVKRIEFIRADTQAQVTCQFKSCTPLGQNKFLLSGIIAPSFVPKGSRVNRAMPQYPHPIASTAPSGFQGSSYTYGLSHSDATPTTFDVTYTANGQTFTGGARHWLYDLSGKPWIAGESKVNPTNYRPYFDGTLPIYLNDGLITVSTCTPLLRAVLDHNWLNPNAGAWDFSGRNGVKTFDWSDLSKRSLTIMDAFAWQTEAMGPTQLNLDHLLTGGSSQKFQTTLAGQMFGSDGTGSTFLPFAGFYYNNTNGLWTLDASTHRINVYAAGKAVSDGSFDNSLIYSTKCYDLSGNALPVVSMNGLNVYTSDNKVYAASWRHGLYRQTGTWSTSGLTTGKIFKGTIYGVTAANKFAGAGGGSAAAWTDCTGILDGGIGTSDWGAGAGYSTNLASGNYIRGLIQKYNGTYINADKTGLVDGSGTWSHEVLGRDGQFDGVRFGGITEAFESGIFVSAIATGYGPVSLPGSNFTGWNDYGNSSGIEWKYNAGNSYQTISGGPWTYAGAWDTYASCRLVTFRFPGMAGSSRINKGDKFYITISHQYGTYHGPGAGMTETAFGDVDIRYAQASYNDQPSLKSLITSSGGSSIDTISITVSPTGNELYQNQTKTYGPFTCDGSQYCHVWSYSTARPDAPHVPPSSSPVGQNGYAAGLGWISGQYEGSVTLTMVKDSSTLGSINKSSTYPDTTAAVAPSQNPMMYSQADDFFMPAPAGVTFSEIFPQQKLNLSPYFLLHVYGNCRKHCFSTMNQIYTPGNTNAQVNSNFNFSMDEQDKVYSTGSSSDIAACLSTRGHGISLKPGDSITLFHLFGDIAKVKNLNPKAGSVSIVGGRVVYTANAGGYDYVIARDSTTNIPGIMPITVTAKRIGAAHTANKKYLFFLNSPDQSFGQAVYVSSGQLNPGFLTSHWGYKITHPTGTTTTAIASTSPGSNDELRYVSPITIAGSGNVSLTVYDNSTSTGPLEDDSFSWFTITQSKTQVDPNQTGGDTITFNAFDGKPWEAYVCKEYKANMIGSTQDVYPCHLLPQYQNLLSTTDGVTWTMTIPQGFTGLENGKKFIIFGKVPGEENAACSDPFTGKPLVSSTSDGSVSPNNVSNGQGFTVNVTTSSMSYKT